jgi:hypothetical protein
MNRKAIVVAVIIAVMSIAGVAGSEDTPANASYFVGGWSGTWDLGPTTKQDVTITIGEKNEKGYNKTTYDYGWAKSGNAGSTPPGSFVVYGREHDGVFSFSWKNKEGFKRTITLEKYKEDEVKAKFDLDGPLTAAQRPYYNSTLKRK